MFSFAVLLRNLIGVLGVDAWLQFPNPLPLQDSQCPASSARTLRAPSGFVFRQLRRRRLVTVDDLEFQALVIAAVKMFPEISLFLFDVFSVIFMSVLHSERCFANVLGSTWRERDSTRLPSVDKPAYYMQVHPRESSVLEIYIS